MRSPTSLVSSSSKPSNDDNDIKDGCSTGKKKGAVVAACCSKVGLKRGPWTAEEDELLSEYIKREGEGKWRTLPKKAGLLRCGKSCRLRWMNYLRPSVKRGHISPDEEDLILRLHRLLGNRWSLIAGRIPGRTDNEIKNYWNTHLSKKLISQGIDPKTHKPISPLLLPINYTPPIPQNIINSTDYPKLLSLPCTSSSTNNYYDVPLIILPSDHQTPDIFQNSHVDHSNKHDLNIISKNITSSTTFNCSSNIDDHKDGDGDHGIANCCMDEAFSSFLNSLINDDMFVNHNQLQEQEEANHLMINPNLMDFGAIEDLQNKKRSD